VLLQLWNWNRYLAIGLLALFFTVDGLYFTANLLKVPDGGWFPLLIGAIAFTLLTTWAKGRQLLLSRMDEASLPMEIFIKSAATSATRVPGHAVFMTSSASGVPHALLHNLKHNKVLHERVILLTVRSRMCPTCPRNSGRDAWTTARAFYRVISATASWKR
jgi:KUP system potassium uptake protein